MYNLCIRRIDPMWGLTLRQIVSMLQQAASNENRHHVLHEVQFHWVAGAIAWMHLNDGTPAEMNTTWVVQQHHCHHGVCASADAVWVGQTTLLLSCANCSWVMVASVMLSCLSGRNLVVLPNNMEWLLLLAQPLLENSWYALYFYFWKYTYDFVTISMVSLN